MSFIFNPETHSCYDPDTGITGNWAGGGGPTDDRCFELSHPDWTCRTCFYLIEEHDIFHDVRMVDRILVSAATTYGENPYVQFAHSLRSIERSGTLDPELDLMNIFHDAMTCLYSDGGRHPIKVKGVVRNRGRAAKRTAT